MGKIADLAIIFAILKSVVPISCSRSRTSQMHWLSYCTTFSPSICRVLPIEEPSRFVSFEWIGDKNYLGEVVSRNGKRTRGANYTSADAAVLFEETTGIRHVALIEWKYTESYHSTPCRFAKSGRDKTTIYEHLYHSDDFPLNKLLVHEFAVLFYEPFYQLLRQQLLANEMERAHELGADIVSLLHIAPAHNRDFHYVTSPSLRPYGNSVIEIWNKLIRRADRFTSVSTEELFSKLSVERWGLEEWWTYISERYRWVNGGPSA